MAKQSTPEPTAADLAREKLRRWGKWLTVIVPAVALLVVLYLLFGGSFGQREEDRTPGLVWEQYAEFAQPFAHPAGAQPMPLDLDRWIAFFDDDSQDFFEKNAARMALRAHNGDKEAVKDFSKKENELAAMRFAVRVPPLNGNASVKELRQTRADLVDLVLIGGRWEGQVQLVREGGRWRIKDFAGVKSRLVEDTRQ